MSTMVSTCILSDAEIAQTAADQESRQYLILPQMASQHVSYEKKNNTEGHGFIWR